MSLIDDYYGSDFEILKTFDKSMLYNAKHDYVWLPVQKDCRPFTTKAWRKKKKYSVGPKGKLLDEIDDFYYALLLLQKMELGDISALPLDVTISEVKTCKWRGEGFNSNPPGVISRNKWVKFSSVSEAESFTEKKYRLKAEEKELDKIVDEGLLTETEKDELRKSRIGQGRFRKNVLKIWDNKCAVVESNILLTASHIKAWRYSDNKERLSGYNGLALSPVYNAAFDIGIISFRDTGEIIISPKHEKQLAKLGIDNSDCLYKTPHKNTMIFLEYHRDKYKEMLDL